MLPSFEGVQDRLLRAGIAPRRARRYASELRDHLEDLLEDERRSGRRIDEARERALARLGTEADLTQSMLQRVPCGTLAARAPWAVFLISPLLVMITALAVIAVSTYKTLLPVRALTWEQMPTGYRTVIDLAIFLANDLLGVLVAAGCIAIALRQRVASAWVWVGLVVISLLNGAIGIHMRVISPQGDLKGGLVFSVLNIVYVDGSRNFVATLIDSLLRTAVLFALFAGCYHVLRLRLAVCEARTRCKGLGGY